MARAEDDDDRTTDEDNTVKQSGQGVDTRGHQLPEYAEFTAFPHAAGQLVLGRDPRYRGCSARRALIGHESTCPARANHGPRVHGTPRLAESVASLRVHGESGAESTDTER